MGIDIFVLILLAIAVFKGWQKGLVVGLFSLLAIIVGAAAALKLSSVAGAYMSDAFPNLAKWIPFLSFVMVFVLVVIAVKLLAKFIEETLEWTMLGWLNKLGGIFFFAILYMLVASIVLFYLNKLGFVSDTAKNTSQTYHILAPLAPTIMDGLGKLIPIFKDLFGELENAFETLAESANNGR
jgi:membrane protein required for colicin V production